MIKYVAASLEDVAKSFEKTAADLLASAGKPKSQREQRDRVIESQVWTSAARILRATTLAAKTE